MRKYVRNNFWSWWLYGRVLMIGRTPNPNCGNFFLGPNKKRLNSSSHAIRLTIFHKKMLNDSRSRLQIQANTGKYKQIQAGKTEGKCDKEGTVITREEINGGGGSQVAQKDLQMQIRSSEVEMQMQIQI